MNVQQLESTAKELVTEGKGLLAADESFGTIGKRFEAVGIEPTEETRRQYREMLFTTEGINEYLSGVILFDETIRQESSDGRLLPRVLEDQGIIPGIKVPSEVSWWMVSSKRITPERNSPMPSVEKSISL